jgi:hypothetical protein
VRVEVEQLLALGPLPDSSTASADQVSAYQALLDALFASRPIMDEEAEALVRLLAETSPSDWRGC